MSGRLRLIAGATTVGVLLYLWRGWVRDYDARIDDDARVLQLVVAAIGLVGGLVMRSWWALVVAPVALIGTAELWEAVACAACPPAREALVILTVVYYGGPAALGAAVGTLLGTRALPATLHSLRRARPPFPQR